MIMTTNGMRYYFLCKVSKRLRNRILFKALYRQVAYSDYDIVNSIEMFTTPTVDMISTMIDVNRVVTTMMYDLNKNKNGN